MAQNTAGVKLVYGTATIAGTTITPPTSWTHIPGLTSFPAMSSAPEALDATTTDELKFKTYIDGLMDLGGSLEFGANHTPALEDTVDAALEANCFAIEYPEPLSERYWWLGKIQPIRPGEVGVNQVLTTTLYISQESEPTKQDITGP